MLLDCTIDPTALYEPVSRARALILKSIRERPEMVSRYKGEQTTKKIVGFAKDDLNSHTGCLLLVSIPLDFNHEDVLPQNFFGDFQVFSRHPHRKSAAI